MIPMPRLRALAVILGCLAVLAGSATTVLASAPFEKMVTHQGASAPCSHCDDCDKVPCPMPMADCVQSHTGSGPALAIAAVELAVVDYVVIDWSGPSTRLTGRSQPPEPFPPRA